MNRVAFCLLLGPECMYVYQHFCCDVMTQIAFLVFHIVHRFIWSDLYRSYEFDQSAYLLYPYPIINI